MAAAYGSLRAPGRTRARWRSLRDAAGSWWGAQGLGRAPSGPPPSLAALDGRGSLPGSAPRPPRSPDGNRGVGEHLARPRRGSLTVTLLEEKRKKKVFSVEQDKRSASGRRGPVGQGFGGLEGEVGEVWSPWPGVVGTDPVAPPCPGGPSGPAVQPTWTPGIDPQEEFQGPVCAPSRNHLLPFWSKALPGPSGFILQLCASPDCRHQPAKRPIFQTF